MCGCVGVCVCVCACVCARMCVGMHTACFGDIILGYAVQKLKGFFVIMYPDVYG